MNLLLIADDWYRGFYLDKNTLFYLVTKLLLVINLGYISEYLEYIFERRPQMSPSMIAFVVGVFVGVLGGIFLIGILQMDRE